MEMDRICSVVNHFLEVLQLTFFALRKTSKRWHQMPPVSFRTSLWSFLQEIFRFIMRMVKLLNMVSTQAWHASIAEQTKKKCERLMEEREDAFRRNSLTEEQLSASYFEIARLMLGAVFDPVSIRHISKFGPRMGLYELVEGKPVFKHVLEEKQITNLMEQGVSAVCVSYKHTRRSREGLPADEARVHKAVAQAAAQLSQQRLLFWCDVIGRTPEGVAWAQQGIDPYLCMPSLRIMSTDLEKDIEDSFWMTIQWVAALYRGGMITYVEDEGTIEFGHGTFHKWVIPDLSCPFEIAKLGTAKLVCNPSLYYRTARNEEDKLEVMKYGLDWVLKGKKGMFMLEQSEERMLLKVGSEHGLGDLLHLVGIDKNFDPSDALGLSRPFTEFHIADGDCWQGVVESFPALKLADPQDRKWLNGELRKWGFLIHQVGPPVDGIADVLCSPLFNWSWCSALRLRVSCFEEQEDRVTGRVVSFRVATEEEEMSLTEEASTHKRVCFH